MLYQILELRASAILDERIKNGDINAQELVEFKVTFELPYPVHEQQLESGNRVEAGGVQFEITSQEYKDNMLTLIGVRDQWAYHVSTVMDAFNKAANGETNADEGIIHSLTNLLMGFDDSPAVALITSGAWARTLSYGSADDDLPTFDIPVDPNPPWA